MSMGKYGYLRLERGVMAAYRPTVMAVSLDESGRVVIDKERGGIDPFEGCVTWRLFNGDRVSVVLVGEPLHPTQWQGYEGPPR